MPGAAGAFTAHATSSVALPEDLLEAKLSSAFGSARSAWPILDVALEAFAAFIAPRFTAEDLATEVAFDCALAALRLDDLYFAAACARGVPGAADAFKTSYFPQIAAALRRLSLPKDMVDDVQQAVFVRLFLPEGERGPRIEQYAGRGRLAAWVRVVAVRLAQNILRDRGREDDDDELVDVVLDAEPDPALELLRAKHHTSLKTAFRRGLGKLSARERNLLRMRVFHGTPVTRLAEVHRVHRMTVTRWLHDIRDKVMDEMRGALAAEVSLPRTELDSLLHALKSSVDVTVTGLFDSKT